MHNLEHVLRVTEVTWAMGAEIPELHTRTTQEFARCTRDQDLAAVAYRHQSGCAIQCRAVIVTIANFGHARVHAHTYAQRTGLAPRLGGQGQLRVDCSIDCI